MTRPLRVGVIGANPNRSWAKDSHIPALRENLFIATSRLSTDGAESFCLPRDRTLIEGSRIEV
jgi:hypothetical protein